MGSKPGPPLVSSDWRLEIRDVGCRLSDERVPPFARPFLGLVTPLMPFSPTAARALSQLLWRDVAPLPHTSLHALFEDAWPETVSPEEEGSVFSDVLAVMMERDTPGPGHRRDVVRVWCSWVEMHRPHRLNDCVLAFVRRRRFRNLQWFWGTAAEAVALDALAGCLVQDKARAQSALLAPAGGWESRHPPPSRPPLSLAAKWAPTEGGAQDRCFGLVKKLCARLGVTRKEYRKEWLTPLRKRLHLPETYACAGDWDGLLRHALPRTSRGWRHRHRRLVRRLGRRGGGPAPDIEAAGASVGGPALLRMLEQPSLPPSAVGPRAEVWSTSLMRRVVARAAFPAGMSTPSRDRATDALATEIRALLHRTPVLATVWRRRLHSRTRRRGGRAVHNIAIVIDSAVVESPRALSRALAVAWFLTQIHHLPGVHFLSRWSPHSSSSLVWLPCAGPPTDPHNARWFGEVLSYVRGMREMCRRRDRGWRDVDVDGPALARWLHDVGRGRGRGGEPTGVLVLTYSGCDRRVRVEVGGGASHATPVFITWDLKVRRGGSVVTRVGRNALVVRGDTYRLWDVMGDVSASETPFSSPLGLSRQAWLRAVLTSPVTDPP